MSHEKRSDTSLQSEQRYFSPLSFLCALLPRFSFGHCLGSLLEMVDFMKLCRCGATPCRQTLSWLELIKLLRQEKLCPRLSRCFYNKQAYCNTFAVSDVREKHIRMQKFVHLQSLFCYVQPNTLSEIADKNGLQVGNPPNNRR